MRKPNGFWNLQNLIDSAKQFDSVSAWSKAAMGAYLAARRKGLIDHVTKHMLSHGESISRARTVWTREACVRSAKRFMKRSDWNLGDRDAYQAARRHGWYVECTSHMTRVKQINGYWNRENCLSEARKHSHISEWLAANPSCYQSAKSNPEWFAACTVHMERLWSKKWAKSAILNDAKKYSTIQEWSRNSTGAYQACWAKGLMPQATAHMIKNPKWFPVATIHQILQSHDLEYVAEQTFEDCRDRRKLPFDFYLPKFGLLIEHQGTQHQRGWSGKGAGAIQRRDEMKRIYAKSSGYAYLEIKEWEIRDPIDVERLILQTIRKISPRSRLVKRDLTKQEMQNTRVRHVFTLDALQEIANKYETRSQFKRGDLSAYTFACRRHLIDSICGHMLSKAQAQRRALMKWTKESVIKSASQFRTSREWATREGAAYNAALREGWTAEASKHFPSRRR